MFSTGSSLICAFTVRKARHRSLRATVKEPCHSPLGARRVVWYLSAKMTERHSPHDLPNAQLLCALARHVLAGREHTYRQETTSPQASPATTFARSSVWKA